MLLHEKRANQIYYRANLDSPIFDELKSIVTKTFGIAEVLRDALNSFAPQIDAAFIYGSVAMMSNNIPTDSESNAIELSEPHDGEENATSRMNRIPKTLLETSRFVATNSRNMLLHTPSSCPDALSPRAAIVVGYG